LHASNLQNSVALMGHKLNFIFLVLAILFCTNVALGNDDEGIYRVGVGRADITGPVAGIVLVTILKSCP